MKMRVEIIVLFSIFVGYVYSTNLAFTIESYSKDGKKCFTDCDKDKCYTSYKDYVECDSGWRKAARYYTTRSRYPAISQCLSKCVVDGYDYAWCYINNNFNWDYCSSDEESDIVWYQYTTNRERCKDECKKRDGTSYLWCHTYSSWDYCEETYYLREEAKTIYGKQCYGDCVIHPGYTDYWCYDEKKNRKECAPSALRFQCPKSRNSRAVRPRGTVAEQSALIDNDPELSSARLSTRDNPDQNNPVLDYTYRTIGDLRLPYRIRARILPPPFAHLQPRNSRGSDSVSADARENCHNMGMNCLQFGNYDHCGHLIPYILGGPPDWYNIAPQSRRINTGTTSNTDVLISKSVWRATERAMLYWIRDGGTVEYDVIVVYDLTTSTRPTGFGTIDRYYTADGHLEYSCDYWYSNDPDQDPDDWNQ